MGMNGKKAVLLITVYRRYHELQKNLERTRERALEELGYMPDVVLVWACPEVGRLWLMQSLQKDGLLTHLLNRPAIPGLDGDKPTTWPESHNLRLGLTFIRDHYAENEHYVIMHAADIWLQGGTLSFIDDRINGRVEEGPHNAVLFHWDNPIIPRDIWSTYMFGVCLDPQYWPPVSPANEQDVLERQWGVLLSKRQLPGLFRWHNARERKFLHRHESEQLPPFPVKPQTITDAMQMQCVGYRSIFGRVWDWLQVAYHKTVKWLNEPVFAQVEPKQEEGLSNE